MSLSVKHLAECLEHSSCSQIVSNDDDEEGGGDHMEIREES